jgi:hypothetical protein
MVKVFFRRLAREDLAKKGGGRPLHFFSLHMTDAAAEQALIAQLGKEGGARLEFLAAAIDLTMKRYPADTSMKACYLCGHTCLVAHFGVRLQVGGPHDIHRNLEFHCMVCSATMTYMI